MNAPVQTFGVRARCGLYRVHAEQTFDACSSVLGSIVQAETPNSVGAHPEVNRNRTPVRRKSAGGAFCTPCWPACHSSQRRAGSAWIGRVLSGQRAATATTRTTVRLDDGVAALRPETAPSYLRATKGDAQEGLNAMRLAPYRNRTLPQGKLSLSPPGTGVQGRKVHSPCSPTKPMSIEFSRVWDMASPDTFDVPSIGGFVRKYLLKSKVSVDPFSRNKRWATHTNDLNPDTRAEYHLEAQDFLELLIEKGVKADLAIFDPPYSLTQVSRSYQDIGLKFKGRDNPTGGFPKVRDLLAKVLVPTAVCLSFGWNSVGLGKLRGFDIVELMLVCHGGNKNDTICMAETKVLSRQQELSGLCEPA